MFKLLLERQNGDQEVRIFNDSDFFQTANTILWDERIDGPIKSDIQLGGMVRIGDQLQLDAGKLSANVAAKQSETDLHTTKTTQVTTLRNRIKALASQSDLTAAEEKEAIMKYIKLKVLQGEP
jgi:hypothetical protein